MMSKQFSLLFFSIFSIYAIIIINSCDVVDLILYEKQVSILRQAEHSETFDVYGSAFDIRNLISKEELLANFDMPEGGKVDSIQIESVLVELNAGPDNDSEDITLDIYASSDETSIFSFINKAVLVLENDEFINPGLISKPDLEEVGALLLKTISTADSLSIPSFNLGIQNNGPVNRFIDVDVKVTIKFVAEINYCALVPGNSSLPECSE